MARRRRTLLPQRHARLEIIPMIDIMMFLLVFFVMITLSMIPNAGVPIELPAAAATTKLDTTPITIGLDHDGRMHLGGETVDLADLGARLTDLGGAHRSVVIAADRTVDFQSVVSAMDAARGAGITSIGLAAQNR